MRSIRSVPVVAVMVEAARTDPLTAIGLSVTLVVAAAMPAALAIGSGVVVGGLAQLRGAGWTAARGYLLPAAGVLGGLFLVQQLVAPVARALAERLGRTLNRAVSDRVMAALGTPPGLEYLEDTATRARLATINSEVMTSNLRDAVVGTANLTITRAGAVVAVLVLAGYHWWVAAALLTAYGYALATVSRMYQRQLVAGDGAPAGMARALYLKSLLATAAPAKEVRVFGLADWLIGQYLGEWQRAVDATRTERRGAVRASAVTAASVLVGQAVAFGPLTLDLMDGRLTPARFTTYAIAAVGCVALLVTTPDLVHIAVGGAVVRAVRDLERSARDHPAPDGRLPVRLTRAIVFEGVSFRYPRSDTWVLRGLDLTIEAGTAHAIVGVNGAGKTTLVKLLCGLYQPTEGRILVDGVDLRHLDVRQWQRQCAALFQDWVRLGLPVHDNVRLGAPDQVLPPEQLDRIAVASGLDAVVAGLPDGWATVLSREFDGVDLSGGQWQRVGLARALWATAAGAGVLVLDEPTSALDVRGESELFDLLLTAAADKTVVLVSHRFATVRRADRIVVLADGRVGEQGTHESLMAAGGAYASMFTAQADRYREGVASP